MFLGLGADKDGPTCVFVDFVFITTFLTSCIHSDEALSERTATLINAFFDTTGLTDLLTYFSIQTSIVMSTQKECRQRMN
jgi:hypothetical protein